MAANRLAYAVAAASVRPHTFPGRGWLLLIERTPWGLSLIHI